MLLLHQIGSVKIGEVVRYTVTYTPSEDRILPSPECLHLRIRNTSLIALRAAFVHGPYQLYVAAAPAHFSPNQKLAHPRKYGVPEFEPMLKAGGYWTSRLLVPDVVRQSAGQGRFGGRTGTPPPNEPSSSSSSPDRQPPPDSVSWVIEVASQVLFSTSAAVHYEILIGRDEKSLDLGSASIPVLGGNQAQVPQPGNLSDFQRSHHHRTQSSLHAKGVYSRAIGLKVEDTAALWDTPSLPGWDAFGRTKQHILGGASVRTSGGVSLVLEKENAKSGAEESKQAKQVARKAEEGEEEERDTGDIEGELRPIEDNDKTRMNLKKVHLVILTHGLHSNLGADMLFVKESIDAGAKQAKIDAKARREREAQERRKMRGQRDQEREAAEAAEATEATEPSKTEEKEGGAVVEDDEEIVVRGFSGNATRTERGIKYLGKRLARYVLSVTYPDQPFLPASLTATQTVARALHATTSTKDKSKDGTGSMPVHKNSTIHRAPHESDGRSHRITKISFVGHSLGGLIQLYAIAYIQKHSPQFFDVIKPVNFVAMATPFLGLNHENPLYVKFALDFGLVGRTGQDLGLTWRAPTLARSGWSAMVESAHKRMMGGSADGDGDEPRPRRRQAESKPLLRILPTGPAHMALEKFRNRTLYCNVVNDGIVPLRTSCLLFLDWQGLDRVEKARREAGLVETVVGFGWSELIGANLSSPRTGSWHGFDDEEEVEQTKEGGPRGSKTGARAGTATSKKDGVDGGVDDDGTSTSTTTAASTPAVHGDSESHVVPQPSGNAILEDDRHSLRSVAVANWGASPVMSSVPQNPFSGFFNLFKGSDGLKKTHHGPPSQKQSQIFVRSQTLMKQSAASSSQSLPNPSASSSRSRVTAGPEHGSSEEAGTGPGGGSGADSGSKNTTDGRGPDDGTGSIMSAPPTTTIFESAGDILNPKIPPVEYLIDPSKRPRTIFHDRVYHPQDIPPPPLKKRPTNSSTLAIRLRPTLQKTPTESTTSTTSTTVPPTPASATADNNDNNPKSTNSSPFSSPTRAPQPRSSMASSTSTHDYDDTAHTAPDKDPNQVIDSSGMRVEEKIARAYHRGLSWRKVLVKLEPDAHNNIIVRRTFANAFGWPVVKHLVDAHFSDSASAREPDSRETSAERAPGMGTGPDKEGKETDAQKEGTTPEGARESRKQQPQKLQTNFSDNDRDNSRLAPSSAASAGRGRLRSSPVDIAEAGEAADTVPDLPSTPSTRTSNSNRSSSRSSPGSKDPSLSRPFLYERLDSVTWSERDWEDSGDDSESDVFGGGGGSSGHNNNNPPPPAATVKPDKNSKADKKKKDGGESGSGGGWNWAEKIVGKGAAARAKSPKSPNFPPSAVAASSSSSTPTPTKTTHAAADATAAATDGHAGSGQGGGN